MPTTAEDVLHVLDLLDEIDVPVWIGGGWGVDALLGDQTREHDDLDISISAEHLDIVLVRLANDGFAIIEDWRPVRIALGRPDGAKVDVHPVVFDEHGDGVQAGLDGATFDYPAVDLVHGSIGGRRVGCLSVERQLLFHTGYVPSDKDRTDVQALIERFGLAAPEGFRV